MTGSTVNDNKTIGVTIQYDVTSVYQLCLLVDQRNGEQSGGKGLRKREFLHEHKVPVPWDRKYTRDES